VNFPAWFKTDPGYEQEVRRRGKRALIWGLPAFVILAATGSASVSLVVLTAVAVALYVPAWNYVRYGKWVVVIGVITLVVLYPFYVANLFEMPVFGAFPSVDTGVTMLIYIMMALGLNIVVGYAGLLDLGYVAFYAMGAYTAAWFASQHFHQANVHIGSVGVSPAVPGIHVSIWIVLVIAGIITAITGMLIGFPTLRLRGDYLAIVTLGFGEIMPQVARNGDHIFGQNITNGPQGINPIDPPGFGNTLHDATGLPDDYLGFSTTFLNHNITSVELFFWTALLLVLFTVFCSVRLRDSRTGRAWIAIREDETAAAAMGVPLMRTKTWAYAAGALFGGIAGAYYASFKSGTFPDDFFFNISVFILCMVILGGMGNIWGVIIGGGFLAYLNQEGLGNIGGWINEHFSTGDAKWVQVFGGAIDVPLYSSGIFGVILVLVMLFRPEGLIPSSRRRAEFHEGVHDQPLYDTQHE
jgi:branched-chain amino acid transport system permease protein